MNKKNILLMMGLILGATGQIGAMSNDVFVVLENKSKETLILRFVDSKTNKDKVVVLNPDESSTSALKVSDLRSRELFVTKSNEPAKRVEKWYSPIRNWLWNSDNYGKANSMIIVFTEEGRIHCQFFDLKGLFIDGVNLGNF